MDRWVDKVALVTGASSGIGRAIVEELVRKGMRVVAMARRIDKIKAYAEELKHHPGKLHPLQCDLTKKDQVMHAMQWIEKNMGNIDVLVNNAGVDTHTSFLNGTMEDWEKTFDVNILGLVAITTEFLMMKKKQGLMDRGHIFNINDFRCFTRHNTMENRMSAPYMASKWAMRGITDMLRTELKELESKIKVTNICPGMVHTEMTMKTIKEHGCAALEPCDVADSIIVALCTRDTVLIRDMIVCPSRDLY
ncbi:farnesol dehydrogenase-like [Neodiprion virginianus]|uniref:farnesol dehydrogenase-like n=1 Tax=Neodiprion virginianus TaxID=2961670 RepID=UPI001EE70821|nr:farnesol dehydrogenase-like [Neodiprion virginianus]